MPTNTLETTVVAINEQELLVCSACQGECDAEETVFFDDQDLCPECAESLTDLCSCCGERIWISNNAGDNSITLCQHCYDNHYCACEGCGAIIHFNSAYRTDDDDGDFCWDCYTHHQSKRKVIHDYHYKPTPEFFPLYDAKEIYLGVELEIDNGGEDSYNAEELLKVANELEEHLYIKHDGSLNDGLELVSHPATLDYHRNHIPWERIISLRRMVRLL